MVKSAAVVFAAGPPRIGVAANVAAPGGRPERLRLEFSNCVPGVDPDR